MEPLTDKERQNKRYEKWIIAFVVFLVFMWICTIISKSIYVSGLPMVQTELPEKKFVEHIVEAEGIVVEGGEQAVTLLDGLRVEKIFVHKGDRIEEGTPLFQIDMEDLKDIVKEKEIDIAKLNYQISDLQANQELMALKKQMEEQRAIEDYTSADDKTGTEVGRAEEDKSKADSNLEKHMDDSVKLTSEKDRKKAWDKYEKWIDREYELIDKITKQERIIDELEAKLETAQEIKTHETEGETTAGEETEDSEGETITGEAGAEEAATAGEENSEEETTAGVAKEKTEEEKAAIEQKKAAIEAAKKELNELRDALTQHERDKVLEPDFSKEDSDYESWKTESKVLQEAIEGAENAKNDAYTNRNSDLKKGERAIEDSILQKEYDSTLSIVQLDLANLQKELDKYKQIIKQEGMVSAQVRGIATDILVGVGERTPDTAVLRLTDDETPCQFKVTLSKEEKKYVNIGDVVDLKLNNNGDHLEATVDYLAENSGSYELYMNIHNETAIPGISGTMSLNVQGESHNLCIPVEALYKEDERYYVFTVKEKEGILGKELYAEKVSVKVKDQNDRYAALEDGALNQESIVITSSTEEIKRNDIIRYQE